MKQKNVWVTLAIAIVTVLASCAKDDFNETVGICPEVVSTYPAASANNVPLDAVITATFNEPVDPETIVQSSFTVEGDSPIAGTLTYAGETATFSPNSDLLPNTTYLAKITTAVKDLKGNALQADYVWTFSTGAVLQPLVISTSPAANETAVLLNKTVSATFNMPMNPTTLTTTSFKLTQGITSIAGVVSYAGNEAFFAPNLPLESNTLYTATITTAVSNTGNIPLAAEYSWSFTTELIVPPTVIATSPINNAINVAFDKVVTATFSMGMNPLSITTSSFTLKQGINTLSAAVTYSGTTASLTPTNLLLPNTNYTATITTNAVSSGDVALVSNYVWDFTTMNTLSVGPDLGSAAQFGAFGGNAGITNQGINTVINGSIGTTAAPTLITGFHDANAVYTETPLNVGNVTGAIFTAPPLPGTAASFAIATQGLADATTAYLSISPASMPGGTDPGAGELGGLTLTPGIYKAAGGTFNITNGNLTLDAQGDPNALWIFQTAAGLTVGIAGLSGAKSVVLINGALPKNVFWYVGSAATINGAGGGTMVGTIMANSGVTFSTAGNTVQTVLNGRAISLIASVTLVNTTITIPQ